MARGEARWQWALPASVAAIGGAAADPQAAALATLRQDTEASSAAQPVGERSPATERAARQRRPDAQGLILVWVDLDLPPLASMAEAGAAERDALRARVRSQQEAVMARLVELGAIEQSRVRHVRNALAVRLPPAQIDAARSIPGVKSVSPARAVDRHPPVSPPGESR
jgi:hypothetical protein